MAMKKSKKLYRAYSISFSSSNVGVSFFVLLELNSKRLYHCSGKEKGSRCFVFTSSRKRESKLGIFTS